VTLLILELSRTATFLQTSQLQVEKGEKMLDIAPEVDLDDVEAENKYKLFDIVIFASFSMAVVNEEVVQSHGQTSPRCAKSYGCRNNPKAFL